MCFSASASFVASGGLVALGGASLAVAKKKEKIIAAIPLMFGVQQAFEGVQWLHLDTGNTSLIAGYSFLVFALIVWPVYVPCTVYMLDTRRRKILKWFIVAGSIVALYYVYILLTQSLVINEFRACINYQYNAPFGNIFGTLYVLTIFGPLFVSCRPIFKWFGLVVAILAIIAWLFFTLAFTSVWCFFAAIISSMFFVYITLRHHRQGKHSSSQKKS